MTKNQIAFRFADYVGVDHSDFIELLRCRTREKSAKRGIRNPKKKEKKEEWGSVRPNHEPAHTHTHTLTHQHTPTHTHTARAGPTSYANEATTAETATCPSRNAVRRPSPLSLPGFTALGRVFAKLLPPVFHWRRFNRGRNALEAPSSS